MTKHIKKCVSKPKTTKKPKTLKKSKTKKKMNAYFTALLKAKQTKAPSFTYNGNKYILSKNSKPNFPVYKKA